MYFFRCLERRTKYAFLWEEIVQNSFVRKEIG